MRKIAGSPLRLLAFATGCGCLSVAALLGTVVVWSARASGEAPARTSTDGVLAVPGMPNVPAESIAAAIPVLELFTNMAKTAFGERSPEVGRELGFLAQLHGALGDLDRAQELYDEAFDILRRRPSTSGDLGWLSNNLGMVHLDRGETSEADELFRRALAALPAARHPFERAVVLQNLASTASQLGSWEEAQRAFLEALTLLRQTGRENTKEYARVEHNYAALRLVMGDHEGARRICERLLARGDAADPALRVALLNDLGEALRRSRLYDAAEQRLLAAVTSTPARSAARAQMLANLAIVRLDKGDRTGARVLAQHALIVLETLRQASPANLVAPLSTLSTVALLDKDLGKAEDLLSRARSLWKVRGSVDDPFAGSLEKGLAVIAWQRADTRRARELASEALALDEAHFRQVLGFGSEAQRLAYRDQTFPYDLLANLGEPRLLAEAVLTMKGAVLESLLGERAHARRTLDARRGAHAATAAAAPVPAPPLSVVDVAALQRALGEGEALVELIRFSRFEGSPQLVPHYGAVVLAAAGDPTWVSLGPAAEVDGLVAGLRQCLWIRSRGSEPPLDCADSTVFQTTLSTLQRRLWEPIEHALPAGTRRVIVSPDGSLHFVPWAALPDEHGRFLCERLDVSQVTSGRDLLRPSDPAQEKTLVALGRNGSRDGRPLAKAEEEARFAADLATQQGWQTQLLRGERATEAALFAAHSPTVLHLSTHGGFQRGREAAAAPAGVLRRPMLRSYVELAPAPAAAATGQRLPTPGDGDGLLTAEEAAALDLSRTRLTVLSACETGLGEVQGGEGVLGLRRGFALAGSQYLLFSLWRIHDDDAFAFITSFYRRLFAISDPARAFEEVQREELVRLRRERSVGEAVLAAGGFVLTR